MSESNLCFRIRASIEWLNKKINLPQVRIPTNAVQFFPMPSNEHERSNCRLLLLPPPPFAAQALGQMGASCGPCTGFFGPAELDYGEWTDEMIEEQNHLFEHKQMTVIYRSPPTLKSWPNLSHSHPIGSASLTSNQQQEELQSIWWRKWKNFWCYFWCHRVVSIPPAKTTLPPN